MPVSECVWLCMCVCTLVSLILMQLLPHPPMRAVKLNLLISAAVSITDFARF